jgi:hypothetical protein
VLLRTGFKVKVTCVSKFACWDPYVLVLESIDKILKRCNQARNHQASSQLSLPLSSVSTCLSWSSPDIEVCAR